MSDLLGCLSKVLVAFTIEFDNTSELRLPHSTTTSGVKGGPWLLSQAMWANTLQFVPDDGAPREQLEPLLRLTNGKGLMRWGWLKQDGEILRPTRYLRRARPILAPLAEEIEGRWTERHGRALRRALDSHLAAHPAALPPYLPVVGFSAGMRTDPVKAAEGGVAAARAGADLSAKLARALLGFTLDYEKGPKVPLPISANLLRVLAGGPTPVRTLPMVTGVSKEGASAALGWLDRSGLVVIDPERRAHLTDDGERAERVWRQRASAYIDPLLANALDDILGNAEALREGLTAEPVNWRANPPYTQRTRALLKDPAARLPHHPMVLHRGGYPDGS
ncbi:MAG: hypothetical protein ACRDXC_03535 [Acidimicrobiales bacterium]